MAKFDKAKFLLASAKVGQHGRGIDKAHANAAADKQTWAEQACLGVAAGQLDLDAIKLQLIHDYRLALPKVEQDDFDVDSATIADCGNTVKGWYYDLQRVIKAGDTFVARVINGEAVTTVRRDTTATQQQKAGKKAAKSSGSTKAAKLPSMAESIAALNGYITAAMADNAKAVELAGNAELATLYANLAKLEAQVSAIANPVANAA